MESNEPLTAGGAPLRAAISASPSPLISAEQLNAVLGQDEVKVFDVRGTWQTPARALHEDYLSGHIPGAVFLDWTKHFIEPDVPLGLAAIADQSTAKKSFQTLGINPDDLVVLYDDYSHMMAGRMWIAMRHWGFNNVRVLNGGWQYWQAQNLEVTTGETAPSTGSFDPVEVPDLRIELEDFLAQQDLSCVIDARGAANFAGTPDDPRTGHIPGSTNVPFGTLLDPQTGLFLGNDALAEVLDKAAPGWRNSSVIATCGSGYAATVLLLALKNMEKTGVLFDGSFAVWKQDPDRPVSQLT